MMYDDNGDPYADQAPVQLTDSDAAEWGRMQRFTPAPDGNAAPWWQNLVSFGVSKAIDNTFPATATAIQGNTRPGSFAGQNGQSYSQRGALAAPPVLASGWLTSRTAGIGGISPLMLIIGGLVVAHVFKK